MSPLPSLKKCYLRGRYDGQKGQKASNYFGVYKTLIWFLQHHGRPCYPNFIDKPRVRNWFSKHRLLVKAYLQLEPGPSNPQICAPKARGEVELHKKEDHVRRMSQHNGLMCENFKSWIHAFVKEIQWATKNELYGWDVGRKNNRCISKNKEEY